MGVDLRRKFCYSPQNTEGTEHLESILLLVVVGFFKDDKRRKSDLKRKE